MGNYSDGRGSIAQVFLFKLIKEIYHNYRVVYEFEIPDTKQRFDIFVIELGIAIEYDGIQHKEYCEFFHKDMNGYILSKKMDKKKEEFCKENGIKLVRIDGNIDNFNKNNLHELIKNIEYPDKDFCLNIMEKKIKERKW